MAVYGASDLAKVTDGFTDRGPAQAFGLGKQNLGEYIVRELKA